MGVDARVEVDAPAETTCWTKPRASPRMGILRWVLAPGYANERFEDEGLFSEKAVVSRSMLMVIEKTRGIGEMLRRMQTSSAE